MVRNRKELGNLWLAKALWDLGGVEFGDFTLGRTTVNSPIYLNPRLLVSKPTALRRAARVISQETFYELVRRRPRVSPFDLVAGVPYGGLHLATAFSLATRTPMIYAYTRSSRPGSGPRVLEGRYQPGQTVLIIDDLATTGGSILMTAALLREVGLIVRDAVVLIDREEGAAERLRRHGYNLLSILSLKVMLNYYLSTGRITEFWHRKCMEYLESGRAQQHGLAPPI